VSFHVDGLENCVCWLQCEKLRAESSMLPGIRAELEALRRRHSAALELMGERDEEVHMYSFFFGSLLRMVNKFSPLDVVERHNSLKCDGCLRHFKSLTLLILH
jgi:hypothetical protein